MSLGDVSPVDSPFVPGEQGIPTAGNTVQTIGVDEDGNPVDSFGTPLVDEDGFTVGQFNYERNVNIGIGLVSSGSLTMVDGADLRVGDLAIGGSTGTPIGPADLDIEGGDFGSGSTAANGLVQIIGVGTVFNNHNLIIPTEFQDLDGGNTESTGFVVPPQFNPGPELGGITGPSDAITNIRRSASDRFDLYVGLSGSGRLDITEGGRAEIRDAAYIGASPTANGVVNVDGLGSYLGVYGNKSPTSQDTANGDATLIGPFGDGLLQVTNGGRVDLFNKVALGSTDGANGVGDGNNGGLQGGTGNIIVDGIGSVARILTPGGGNDDAALAVGAFFGDGGAPNRLATFFTTVDTFDDYGSGNVTIRNGGLLQVLEDPGNNLDQTDDDSEVRVGFHGVVELSGGRLEVGFALDNDGIIRTGDTIGGAETSGDGTIDLNVFLNSPDGIVEVTPGRTLHLRSRGDQQRTLVTGVENASNEAYFFGNTGRISVQGDDALGKATFIADRIPIAGQPTEFRNFALQGIPGLTPPGGADAPMFDIPGIIEAQDATLDFRSGLINSGRLLFTGGDNVVSGFVENDLLGDISVSNDASVTFMDTVINDGNLTIADDGRVQFADSLFMEDPNSLLRVEEPSVVTVAGSAAIAGEIALSFGGGEGSTEFGQLQIVGDAQFLNGSTLDLTLTGFSGLDEGDRFDLITVDGTVMPNEVPRLVSVDENGNTIFFPGTSRVAIPGPNDPAGQLFLVADTDLSDGAYTLEVLRAGGTSNAVFCGDLNGDGVIDRDDVAIWHSSFPIASGATRAVGDVDEDGDVDITDLHELLSLVGTAPVCTPGAGAGAGSALPTPEPTSALLALLAAGAVGLRRSRGC
ncbi:MAG: hypothetical protein AAGJ46_17140 [Planctomycetota bacterium]